MFIRLVQVRIDEQYIDSIDKIYDEKVLSELEKIPGCLYGGIIRSSPDKSEFISMTIWSTKDDAQKYEVSGQYQKILEGVSPYFADSKEWKIQLSKDLKLEYGPVAEEPVLKQLDVKASIKPKFEENLTSKMHIRIVSLHAAEGKLAEFNRLYKKEIIPALKKTKGCRYIFLTENHLSKNEILSITIWDSKKYADEYEKSGLFDELTQKVEHTLSDLDKWKRTLESEPGHYSISTEDMQVSHYEVVSGRIFIK